MKSLKTATFLIIILFGIISCSKENDGNGIPVESGPENNPEVVTVTSEQFAKAGMELGSISNRNFSDRIKVTGILDVPPAYKADVSVFYGGAVKSIQLLPGQAVKKGEALFVMENPEYVEMQQNYLTARNKLSYLKAEYERQKELYEAKISSKKKYTKAESDYFTALAEYNALEKKLGLLNINTAGLDFSNLTTTVVVRAPISGSVTAVNITRGQFLNPNTVAVSIVGTDHIHLELKVFEKDIAKIKKGQTVRFVLPDNPGKHYDGEVFLVSKAVNEIDRTINIHGHLKNESIKRELLPGMYIEAEIFVNENIRPALPSGAIVDVDGEKYILVQEEFNNNKYVFGKIRVETGKSNDGFTEIINPESIEGKKVLVKGAFNLIQ